MCGIVACCSPRPATEYLLPALRRLEYRGYDSAGIAVLTGGAGVRRLRSVGRIAALADLAGNESAEEFTGVGIGHTRWATHGFVTEANAHPHIDCAGAVHVVHNGIIDNAAELRAELTLQGHRIQTDVDSEVLAHVVEDELRTGVDLLDAVQKAVARLTGSWALAVVCRGLPSVVVTAHGSPLVIAHTESGTFAASDMTALAGRADAVQVLQDGDFAELHHGGIRWKRADGSHTTPPLVPLNLCGADVELGGAPDFMAKEIAEQPATIGAVVDRMADGIADGSLWTSLHLPVLSRVRFVACGTSLNAAAVLARLLAQWGVPASLAPASELDGVVVEPHTLTVALSQSGETADVLRALDGAAGRTSPLLALTNAPHSTLGRSADALVDLQVGPEIGVAATKTFTAQVAAGAAVLLSGLVCAGRLDRDRAAELADELRRLPAQLTQATRLAHAHVAGVAADLADAPGFLYVARGVGVPYAAEGALKLKEITYRWAECHAAGELKHGPIALIGSGTPVVVIDDGHPKLAANVAEMAARRARIITVGGDRSTLPYRREPAPDVPWGPLPAVVTLQHLAREIAVHLGRDVDKPRNLAKSVTVE